MDEAPLGSLQAVCLCHFNPHGNVFQVLYSIDACIKNFRMMNLPLDMEKPTSSYRVGSCFANPEKGTYFDGTGYAKAGEAQYSS